MTTVGKVSVEVGAKVAEFNRKMTSVQKTVGQLRGKINRSTGALGKFNIQLRSTSKQAINARAELNRAARQLQRISSISLMAAASLGGVGAALFKMGAEFDDSITRTSVLIDKGQLLRDTYNQMSDAATKLAESTRHTADEIGRAQNFLAMAGFDKNDITEVMPAIANMATISGEAITKVADDVSNMMTQFNMGARETSRFVDDLALVTISTNVSMGELARSMRKLGSDLDMMNVPFQEGAAAIGLLGNMGIKADVAGRGLGRMMSSLVSPTKKAAKMMKFLGIESGKVAKPGGITHVVDRLEKARRKLRPDQFVTAVRRIFDVFGGRTAASLSAAGAENIRILVRNMAKAEGLAKKMAKAYENTALGQLDIMRSRLKTIGIGMGQYLFPAFKKLSDMVFRLSLEFKTMSPEMKSAVANFGMLAFGVLLAVGAVAALGAVIAAVGAGIGAAFGAIMALFNPFIMLIMAAVLAIGFLAAEFKEETGSMAGFWDYFIWDVLVGGLRDSVNFLISPFDVIFRAIAASINEITLMFMEMNKTLIEVVRDTLARLKNIPLIGGAMFSGLHSDFKKEAKRITKDIAKFKEDAVLKEDFWDPKHSMMFGEKEFADKLKKLLGTVEKEAGGIGDVFGTYRAMGEHSVSGLVDLLKHSFGTGIDPLEGSKEFEETKKKFEALVKRIKKLAEGMLPGGGLDGKGGKAKKAKEETSKFWDMVYDVNRAATEALSKFPEITSAALGIGERMSELRKEMLKEQKIVFDRMSKAKAPAGDINQALDAVSNAFNFAMRQLSDKFRREAVNAAAGAASLAQWEDAISTARDDAFRLELEKSGDVNKASSAMDVIEDDIRNASWYKLPDIAGDSIQDAFSKASLGGLKNMKFSGPVAKAIGKQFGGALETLASGELPRMGGFVGGLIGTMFGGNAVIGQAIGSGVENVLIQVGESLKEGIEKTVGTILSAVETFIPESRFTGALREGFKVEHLFAAVAAVLAVPFLPALVAVAAHTAAFAVMMGALLMSLLPLIAVLGAVVSALAMLFSALAVSGMLIMTLMLSILAWPMMILGAALTALTAVVTGLVGIFGLFFALATQTTIEGEEGSGLGPTPPGYRVGRNDENALPIVGREASQTANSFARFRQAFEGSVDKLIGSTNQLFESLMPLAGAFDAFVDVMAAFYGSFDTDIFGQVMFDVFKNLLVMLARTVLAFAHIINITVLLVSFINALNKIIEQFGNALLTLVVELPNLIAWGILNGMETLFQSIPLFGEDFSLGLDYVNEVGEGAAARLSNAFGAVGSAFDEMGDLNGSTIPTGPLKDAVDRLDNLSLEEGRIRAEHNIALQNANDEISESLSNIPDGFKVAAEQFKAISIGDVGSPSGVNPFTYAPEGGAASSIGTVIHIERVELQADSPEEMANQLESIFERQNIQRTGSPVAAAISGGA